MPACHVAELRHFNIKNLNVIAVKLYPVVRLKNFGYSKYICIPPRDVARKRFRKFLTVDQMIVYSGSFPLNLYLASIQFGQVSEVYPQIVSLPKTTAGLDLNWRGFKIVNNIAVFYYRNPT